MDEWACRRGVRLQFIEPGKPIRNALIESFNSRLREECLNEQVFVTLDDARRKLEAWRRRYNCDRPHSSLGYLTPEEFAACHQAQRTATTTRPGWPAPTMLAGAVPGAAVPVKESSSFSPQASSQ